MGYAQARTTSHTQPHVSPTKITRTDSRVQLVTALRATLPIPCADLAALTIADADKATPTLPLTAASAVSAGVRRRPSGTATASARLGRRSAAAHRVTRGVIVTRAALRRCPTGSGAARGTPEALLLAFIPVFGE